MNTRLTLKILAILALTVATAMAAPITLPIAQTGINKIIDVTSHPYDLDGGGLYVGTVNGMDAWFWCIDVDNMPFTTGPYRGNVIAIDDTWVGGTNPLVTKGTATNFVHKETDYTGATGTVDLSVLTPEQRFQVAAVLISQVTGDPTADLRLTRAAWTILDTDVEDVHLTGQAKDQLVSAVQEVLAYPTVGYKQWALVSGPVTSNGTIDYKGDDRPYQTFLVQLNETPEPATYAMLGFGLLGLAIAKFRKKA